MPNVLYRQASGFIQLLMYQIFANESLNPGT